MHNCARHVAGRFMPMTCSTCSSIREYSTSTLIHFLFQFRFCFFCQFKNRGDLLEKIVVMCSLCCVQHTLAHNFIRSSDCFLALVTTQGWQWLRDGFEIFWKLRVLQFSTIVHNILYFYVLFIDKIRIWTRMYACLQLLWQKFMNEFLAVVIFCSAPKTQKK